MLTHYLLRFILSPILCLLLLSCGFQLQGQSNVSAPLSANVFVEYADRTDPTLKQTLQQQFTINHTQPAKNQKHATLNLHILDTQFTKKIDTISTSTNTRQYRLSYLIHYTLQYKQGTVKENNVQVQRNLTVDINQLLASEHEGEIIKQEMRNEAIQMMFNQLRIASETS